MLISFLKRNYTLKGKRAEQIIMIIVKDFRYLSEIFTRDAYRIFRFSFPMETEGCHPLLFNTFIASSKTFFLTFLNSFALGLFEKWTKRI